MLSDRYSCGFYDYKRDDVNFDRASNPRVTMLVEVGHASQHHPDVLPVSIIKEDLNEAASEAIGDVKEPDVIQYTIAGRGRSFASLLRWLRANPETTVSGHRAGNARLGIGERGSGTGSDAVEALTTAPFGRDETLRGQPSERRSHQPLVGTGRCHERGERR